MQWSKTFQSDQNQRNLAYVSVYYDIRRNPLIQGGVSYFSMKHSQASNLYFTPEKLRHKELFLKIGCKENASSRFYFIGTFAIGKQVINSSEVNTTLRIESKLGIRLNALDLNLTYTKNTASQYTVGGFSSTGLRLNLARRL